VDLEWLEGQGTTYRTTLHLSNRRAPYTGQAMMSPAQTGVVSGFSFGAIPLGLGANGYAG
jgi:hypothetical protein